MINNPASEIEMLTQPLTTEDGFLNEACMNELAAAINNMPESFERLAGDPEWSISGWTSVGEITGHLAHWAVRQSVGLPPNLNLVIGFTHAAVCRDTRFISWGNIGKYAELSLCEVNSLLWNILRDLKAFSEWNDIVVMEPLGLQWIDLSALLHNVCISIRNERRHSAAFDAKLEKEQSIDS